MLISWMGSSHLSHHSLLSFRAKHEWGETKRIVRVTSPSLTHKRLTTRFPSFPSPLSQGPPAPPNLPLSFPFYPLRARPFGREGVTERKTVNEEGLEGDGWAQPVSHLVTRLTTLIHRLSLNPCLVFSLIIEGETIARLIMKGEDHPNEGNVNVITIHYQYSIFLPTGSPNNNNVQINNKQNR